MNAGRGELQTELAARLGSSWEARFILDEVLGRATVVSPTEAHRARSLAERCVQGEPLQYVLGHWAFRTLDVVVDERVLIPRPETEQVVEVALDELSWVLASRESADANGGGSQGPVVVDLGTGSGAIALSVAAELHGGCSGLRIIATDASPDALEVARCNRQALGASDPGAAERVTLRQGSWWEAVPAELCGRVDLVISNPPYVSEAEWPSLDASVRVEPHSALVAGASSDGTPGLADVEAVLSGCSSWLARPGVAVIELAPHQADAACELARAAGASAVRVEPDLAGRLRALVARFDR
jgi:release factor glutamine methyltransferase